MTPADPTPFNWDAVAALGPGIVACTGAILGALVKITGWLNKLESRLESLEKALGSVKHDTEDRPRQATASSS